MAEINLPIKVSIQNLQQIVQEMQSKLSNLKVGSSGFKMMQNDIRKLQAEIDRLQGQASKPFINERQFDSASRSVEKIEDRINQLQIDMSRLKFGDLELNSNQQHQLDEFNNRIKEIQTSLTQLKQQAKADFLASDMGKIWGELNPTAVTKSLDQITRSIESQVTSQQKKIKELENNLNDYQRVMNMGTAAEKFANAKNPLSREGMGADFFKFFNEDKNGKLSFKAGQKPLFEEWLEQNLNIDPGVAHRLVQNSANQVKQELQDAQSDIRKSLSKSVTQGQKAKVDYNDKNTQLVQQNNELAQNIQMLRAAAEASDRMTSSDTNLRASLTSVTADFNKWKDSVTSAAQSSNMYTDSARKIKAECQQLHSTLATSTAEFMKQQRVLNNFNSIKMAIVNFMGFRQVLNLVKRGVQDALNHIKELDAVMNKISIVTNMTTGDLWKQVDSYSAMAQKYGTSIKGAYEVSQIYYQQGLQTKDVLTLTNETLKLAKISGLDYAQTTDYMTTALRGFKMEMSEASTVVDVYSNLAAHTAVTQEELAVAMSKTASSLESVGSTFQESSAMISTMVAVTRESATNIGSALKSIAARYGEMKKDPMTLVDSEGEALAFNKVDTALQSVGISMRTVDGQFRDFTDVIIELSEKWDQLDSTQQRYIATQFAGNRQQSRFLALVSNGDLLKSNLQYAENSEDTGTIQALKALDSIESKTEQVRVAYQQMYTTIGAEDVWKGMLDGAKNLINTLNGLPKLFGKIPLGAVAMIADIIKVIKDIGIMALGGISKIWDKFLPDKTLDEKGTRAGMAFAKGYTDAIEKSAPSAKEAGEKLEIAAHSGAKEKTQDAVSGSKAVSPTQKADVGAAAINNAAEEVAKEKSEIEASGGIVIPTHIDFDLGEYLSKLNELSSISNVQITAGMNFASALNEINSDFLPYMQNLISQIDFSSPQGIEQLQEYIKLFIDQTQDTAPQLYKAFQNAGNDAIAGLVAGLMANTDNATTESTSVGTLVIEALKNAMGCHSPSVFSHIAGANVITGLADGLTESSQEAVDAARAAGTSVIEALKSSMEFTDISFDAFKNAILSEIDKLGPEIDEATKSLMKSTASNMTLQDFNAGLAPEEFYQWAGMRKSYYVKQGASYAKKQLQADNAAQKAAIARPIVGDDGLTNEQRAEFEARKNANKLQYRQTVAPLIKRRDEIAPEIDALEEKSAQLQREKIAQLESSHARYDTIQHYREIDPDKLLPESEYQHLVSLRKEYEQLQSNIDFAGRGENYGHGFGSKDIAQRNLDAINHDRYLAEKENREQLSQADKADAKIDRDTEYAERKLDEGVDTLIDKITETTSTAVEKANKVEEEIIQQNEAALGKTPHPEDVSIDYAYAISQVKRENNEEINSGVEPPEAELLVKPKISPEAVETVEEKIQEASSGGLSIDEQIAKWQELKNINAQLQEAQKNKDESRIDDLQQQQWATANSLGIGQGYKSFLPEEIDNQIDKLRNESNITVETHADTQPMIQEVKEGKEQVEKTEQLSLFDSQKTDSNLIDPVIARQQELLKFYGGNKNAMFAQMGNSDDELRATAERGAGSPEQAEINFQALKGLQEQRIEIYNQEIEALNRLKAARAELDDVSKKENPEVWAEKNAAFQDARRAYQDISGEKLNSNLGQQKIQEQIDSITAKRDLIIEPQVKINPEEVTKPIEEVPPVKIPVEPQQVKMDLDHPGQDNFVYVTPQLKDEEKIKEDVDNIIKTSQGQITIDTVLNEQSIEDLKKQLEELNNYKFDSTSGNFIGKNGNSMSEADYMQARSNITTQLDNLYAQVPTTGSAINDGLTIDTSSTKAQIQDLIDKLVETGTISKQAGDEMKDGLANASPDELNAKLEELKEKAKSAGEAGTAAGSKLKQAFGKNIGTIGASMSMLAGLFDKTTSGGREAAGAITAIGGAIRIVDALSKAAAGSNPWMALAMGIMAVVNGISLAIEDDNEKLERLNKKAEESSNAAKQAKAESRDLQSSIDKINELGEKRYESAESAEEYASAVEDLTDKFPGLIAGFDSAGNAILDVTAAEEELTAARAKAARAAINAANDAKEARAQEMKNKAKEMASADMSDFTASWQTKKWDSSGAVSKSTYDQKNTEFGKTTQALAEMGGWSDNSAVMKYMMTGGAIGRFSPLWDAENNQYVIDEGEVQRYAFWGADALTDPASLDIIKSKAYGTAFDPSEWSGLQGEMSAFYSKGIDAINSIPKEMGNLSENTKAYLSSMTSDTLKYNQQIVAQYGLQPGDNAFSRVDSILPFINGNYDQIGGTDYLRQFTGFGNAAFVEAKAGNHYEYDWLKDPARQAYLNGENVVNENSNQDADWRQVTVDEIRITQGDTAANNVARFLLGQDTSGKDYFNGSDWYGTGNTEAAGGVGQLLKLVKVNAEKGDTYNTEFFYNALEPLVSFLGQDWMSEHGFGNAWNEVTQIMEYLRDAKRLNRSDDLTMLSESTNLLAASRPDEHKYDFISQSSGLSSIMYSQMLDSKDGADVLASIKNGEDPALAMFTYGNDFITAYSEFYDQLLGRINEDGEELTAVFERMLADPEHYSDADIIAWCEKYGIKVDGVVADALNSRLDQSSTYYEGLLDSNLKKNKDTYKDSAAFNRLNKFLHGQEKGFEYLGLESREYTKVDTTYFSRVMAQASKLTDQGQSEAADKYVQASIETFKQLAGLDATTRKILMDSIAKNGIITKEGIDKVIADAKKLGVDTTYLEQLRDNIVSNLSLEIQAVTEEFLEKWKDSSKRLKKLTTGIDFTEVDELIEEAKNFDEIEIDGEKKKFTLDRSDFIASGEKLVLTEEKAMEYWQFYSASMNKQADDWQDALDTSMGALGAESEEDFTQEWVDNLDLNDEKVRQYLSTISGGKSDALITQNEKGEWTATGNLLEAITSGYDIVQTGIYKYRDYVQYSGEQIVKSAQWANGNFESLNKIYEGFTGEEFEKYKGLSPDKLTEKVNDRLKVLASGMERMTDEERAQPDIVNAVKQVQTSTSKYINDLVTKDIKTLYAQDYIDTGRGKDIIEQEMAAAQTMTAKQFAQWIAGLAQEAGQTIQEQNDAFLKAWNKVHAKDTLDGFKDVQFLGNGEFTATTSQLKAFADTYELRINDLINNGWAFYDEELDRWTVDYASIDWEHEELDFSSIDGFQETVQDSIDSFFDRLGKLVENGLKGSLSNTEAHELQQYASQMGFTGDLSFERTNEGLKLSNKSAIELYQTVKKVDNIAAHVVFDKLKDSLIESDDRFKSISSQTAYMAKTNRNLRGAEMMKKGIGKGARGKKGSVEFFDKQNGNVDLYNRPKIDNEDGSYSTLLTATLESRNFESDIPWVMNITPIPPDAKDVEDILSDDELHNYVQDLLDKHPQNGTELLRMDADLENGGKGLIINLKEAKEVTDDLVESMDGEAETLHEMGEVYESIIDGEEFDSTKIEQYEQELELAKEIMRVRSTTEDDSFKFMDQDIPSGQKNPLNYWNNWAKAFEAINNSMSAKGKAKGHMKYEDFYNMVTEMGNLAEITGQGVNIGGRVVNNAQEAAALIEEAGRAMENVDGEMQINLGDIGIDFASGADKMADDVDAGIRQVAQSQIDMLDSMISLFETIVGMEQLGDLDIDDDMVISVPEILLGNDGEADGKLDETGTFIEQYGSKYEKVRQNILNAFKNDDGELNECLKNVTVNGHTMEQILNASEKDLKEWGIKANDLSLLLTNLFQLSKSDDFDIDKPWESFMELFSNMNWGDLQIGANAGNHSIVLTDEGSYSVEWSSDYSKKKMRGALDEWSEKSDEELETMAQEAYDAVSRGEADVKQNFLIKLLGGKVQVKKIDGQNKFFVNNKAYDTYQEAVRASALMDAGIKQDEIQFEAESASGQMTIEDQVIDVVADEKGNVTYTYNGKEYKNKHDALVAVFEHQNEGESATDENGADSLAFKKWKVKQGIEVMPTFTFAEDAPKITKEAQERARELINAGDWKTLEEEFKVTLNPSFEEGTATAEEVAELNAAFGIEDKTINLNALVSATGDVGLATAISAGETTVQANINILPENLNMESAAKQIVDNLQAYLNEHPITPKINNGDSSNGDVGGGGGGGNVSMPDFSKSTSALQTAASIIGSINSEGIANVKKAVDGINPTNADNAKVALNSINSTGADNAKAALNGINATNANSAKVALNAIDSSKATRAKSAINGINVPGSKTTNITFKYKTQKASAAGNIGALAKGNIALAGGSKTLVGELGPEMVVSNGRYFLVGENGAEFVNLEKDAIVFNHKQTERLLAQGGIGSRGVPFTNETNAISYAKGNISGPAFEEGTKEEKITSVWIGTPADSAWSTKAFSWGAAAKGRGPALASASAALTALKQIRAMWESLLKSSTRDLAGMGGSGGGGGGGGSEDPQKQAAFIKELEKWYNWLQKIAELETKINYEEALRKKITSQAFKSGKAYYNSQRKTLDYLEQELDVTKDLMVSQQKYFEERRAALNKQSAFSALYTFDEDGQLVYSNQKKQYKDQNGKNFSKTMTGFEFLSELNSRNSVTGQAKYTAKQQYDILVKNGFGNYMKYDASGNAIFTKENQIDEKNAKKGYKDEAYTAALQAFWDKIDADKEEMQSLHDSVNEYSEKIFELQQQQNELLREMQDNQIDLENDILKAIEDSRQKNIDKLEDLKNAYQDASQEMISGLNDSLKNEREQYSKNQEEADLLKLRRRLALLQRSGGSASEIASLQKQIQSKSQDMYFSEQQRQIDAIQEASDKQIEKMDQQIDILTKTLEYEKENGLLWEEVYEIMDKTPEEIRQYLTENTTDFLSKSQLAKSRDADDWLFKAEQWKEFQSDLYEGTDNVAKILQTLSRENGVENDLADSFEEEMKTEFGDTWNKLSSKDRAAARQKFIDTYKATGDYAAAVSAGRNSRSYDKEDEQHYGMKAGAEWNTKKETLTSNSRYGESWNNINSELQDELEAATRSGNAEAIQAAEKKIAESGDAFEKSEREQAQFIVENKDGRNVISKVEAGTQNAMTYEKAHQAQASLDFEQGLEQELISKYGSTYEQLDATRKSKIKNDYINNYVNYGKDKADSDLSILDSHLGQLGTEEERANETGWKTTYNAESNLTEVTKVADGEEGRSLEEMYESAELENQQRAQAWDSFKLQFGSSWNYLDNNSKNKLKQIFDQAYNNSTKEDRAADASSVLKNSSDYKTAYANYLGTAAERDNKKKIWATYKNGNVWIVRKARKSTKTKTNFATAEKTANNNNKLYNQYVKDKAAGKKPKAPKYNNTYAYDIGGMVESTGTALLHAKEAVLTSQQADILRNDILGSNKNSLVNLLLDFRKAYNNIGNPGIAAEPTIIIQNASVNMNIDQIANDYDARRAGEQALTEMLRIARKNGAASTLRR